MFGARGFYQQHDYIHTVAEPTQRDEVWSTSLTKALQQGEEISPADVAKLTDVSERVCRETMYVMHERGWLNRQTSPDGSVYYEQPYWLEFHEYDYPGDP